MRKITFALTLICAINAHSFAQYVPKGKLNKAEASYRKGELDIAKAEIDKAFEIDEKGKVSKDPKAYYFKGLIYAALDTTKNENYASLASNPLKTAVEAFDKADKMDPDGKKLLFYDPSGVTAPVTLMQQRGNLWGYYLNNGVEYYNGNELEKALVELEKGMLVKPTDTTTFLYGGSIAYSLEKTDDAIKYYKKYLENGGANSTLYKDIVSIYQQKEDYAKAAEAAQYGYDHGPADMKSEFGKLKVQSLILGGKADVAENEIKTQIQNHPKDKMLHFYLGIIYDEQDKSEDALQAYLKALEIDPKYYEANYNAGAIYFNQGRDVINELNNMDSKLYNKNYDDYRNKAKEKFRTALPYFEKALEIKTNDAQAMETLAYMYEFLGQKDKAEAMKAKAAAISGSDNEQ